MQSQAIKVMRRELERIQRMMQECVTESGIVKNEYKYKYQMLVDQAKSFKDSIDWLEKLYNEKAVV